MRNATRVVIATALAAVLAFATIALANTKTITDPDDMSEGTDIKTASHGHTKTGKLKHVIKAYENFGNAGAPCLNIKTPTASFVACGNKLTKQSNNKQTPIGYRRPNQRTVVYIFSKDAIGNPGRYRWFTEVFTFGGPGDRAPDSGRVRHGL